MSPKITAVHEVTKKSVFRSDPFRGELLLEPRTRPRLMVDRTSHAPGLRVILKDHIDLSELEALIAVLQAIRDELTPKDDVTDGASE